LKNPESETLNQKNVRGGGGRQVHIPHAVWTDFKAAGLLPSKLPTPDMASSRL
jgi:hypothetical protein